MILSYLFQKRNGHSAGWPRQLCSDVLCNSTHQLLTEFSGSHERRHVGGTANTLFGYCKPCTNHHALNTMHQTSCGRREPIHRRSWVWGITRPSDDKTNNMEAHSIYSMRNYASLKFELLGSTTSQE